MAKDDITKLFIPTQERIDYYASRKVIGSCPSCGLPVRIIDCISKERKIFHCNECRFTFEEKSIIPF